MGFKCGIVGLPNVGKSTLFNALTQAGAAAENYPFCTIEPNVGRVPVPDSRLGPLAAIVQPERVLPAVMEFVDIAGLVEGASRGEGLGNQFLGHIRETQAIAHVVRCFEDEDITHVAGRIDPVADVEVINTELALADMETVARHIERAVRASRSGDREALERRALLERIQAHLDAGRPVRSAETTTEERVVLDELHLLTAKPTMYIANVAEQGFQDNPHLEAIRRLAAAEGAEVVPVCAGIEAEIAELPCDERAEFLEELGMAEPGLDRVIRTGYRLLRLQTYFTAGVKEVRAWTIPAGATAPEAAGVIHTDFERGFIRAEVISYESFVGHGGEQGAKEAGKWRLEGRDYVVQDGDVIHFRFNV